MTSNNSSSIRFSVEESVWFKKGQEVSDLIGMSLDPEISVQEHEDYISIRGALVLTGDYRPLRNENDEEDQDIFSLREITSYRTVDEVKENDEGIYSMTHRFPIDITIPTHRIRSLEDVYVLIESFDYEIPERGKLELKADLSISGIINERETASSTNNVQENVPATETPVSPIEQNELEQPRAQTVPIVPSNEPSNTENDNVPEENAAPVTELFRTNQANAEDMVECKFPSFYSEARKERMDDDEPIDEIDFREDVPVVENHIENPNPIAEPLRAETKDEDAIPVAENVVKIEEANPTMERQEEIDQEPEGENEIPVNLVAKTPQIEMKGRSEQQNQGWNSSGLYSPQQKNYKRREVEEEVEAETTKRTMRTENALYLTKILTSGENDFSRLRIRIVQTGETLGSIAEAYDISPNQIIRLNNLEDDVVKEGQMLYIPEYAGVEK